MMYLYLILTALTSSLITILCMNTKSKLIKELIAENKKSRVHLLNIIIEFIKYHSIILDYLKHNAIPSDELIDELQKHEITLLRLKETTFEVWLEKDSK